MGWSTKTWSRTGIKFNILKALIGTKLFGIVQFTIYLSLVHYYAIFLCRCGCGFCLYAGRCNQNMFLMSLETWNFLVPCSSEEQPINWLIQEQLLHNLFVKNSAGAGYQRQHEEQIQIWLLTRVYKTKMPKGIHLFVAFNLDSRGLSTLCLLYNWL